MKKPATAGKMDFKEFIKGNESLGLQTIESYKNNKQTDARNFLAFRIFATHCKDKIEHKSLEKEARKGEIRLSPNIYTTYLPCVKSNTNQAEENKEETKEKIGSGTKKEVKVVQIELTDDRGDGSTQAGTPSLKSEPGTK